MGEDKPIRGYGIPATIGPSGREEANVVKPPHPMVQELRHTIDELTVNLKEARGEKDRLFRQIEEMIVQAKEGL